MLTKLLEAGTIHVLHGFVRTKRMMNSIQNPRTSEVLLCWGCQATIKDGLNDLYFLITGEKLKRE